MKGFGTRATVLLLFLSLGLGLGPGRQESQAQTPPDEGTLVISTRTAEEISGYLFRAGTQVSFTSRALTPTESMVELQVNAAPFDASADHAKQVVQLNGHGNSFSQEELDSLVALANGLDVRIRTTSEPSRPHEDMLFRVVNFLSEAPVGMPFESQQVGPPVVRPDSGQTLNLDAPRLKNCNKATLSKLSPFTRAKAAELYAEAGCQVADDDGIVFFGCGQNENRDLAHDAVDLHCFQVEANINVGPCTANCKGRCGAGCGPEPPPNGAYTRDCAEHDQCARWHGSGGNPWDPQCGDEYWDADDDFLFGNDNCDGCGNAS